MGRPPSGRCNIFLPRLTDWSFWLLKMAVKYTLKAPVAAPCPMFFPLTPSPQCCGWSSTRHSTRQTCLQPFFFLTAHTQRLLHSPKPELFALMVRDGKERSIKNNYLRQKKKKKRQAKKTKHHEKTIPGCQTGGRSTRRVSRTAPGRPSGSPVGRAVPPAPAQLVLSTHLDFGSPRHTGVGGSGHGKRARAAQPGPLHPKGHRDGTWRSALLQKQSPWQRLCFQIEWESSLNDKNSSHATGM